MPAPSRNVVLNLFIHLRQVGLPVEFVSPDRNVEFSRMLTPQEAQLYRKLIASDVQQQLTERQSQILRMVVGGKANKEIAYELGMPQQSVKNQMTKIFRYLGATNRTQAVVIAVQKGLVKL